MPLWLTWLALLALRGRSPLLMLLLCLGGFGAVLFFASWEGIGPVVQSDIGPDTTHFSKEGRTLLLPLSIIRLLEPVCRSWKNKVGDAEITHWA